MTTPKIGIITGTTRPTRICATITDWVYAQLEDRDDATFEILDIADFDLPLLSEPQLAASGKYEFDATKRWSAAVAACDGYIFVTPEYNHSISGSLKNALDHLYHEFVHKAAGFVGYSFTEGIRPVEHLRLIMANYQVATVRAQGTISLIADMTDNTFTPRDHHAQAINSVAGQVIEWTTALAVLRK